MVVTQADAFMGPDIGAVFSEHGAEVIADTRDLTAASAAADLIAEDAQLALFLASDESDFLVGQVIPFAGGWVV